MAAAQLSKHSLSGCHQFQLPGCGQCGVCCRIFPLGGVDDPLGLGDGLGEDDNAPIELASVTVFDTDDEADAYLDVAALSMVLPASDSLS